MKVGWRRNTWKWERSKTPNKTRASSRAIWMFTCWIFYQFCFYLSSSSPSARCYLCSRYWAMHWGCVVLIRTVIDGRVDDLSFRLNTRLDICLPAAFACFPPVYGNLSPYSLCHWEDTAKKKRKKRRQGKAKIHRNKNSKQVMMKHFHSDNSTKCKNSHTVSSPSARPPPTFAH